MTEKIREVRLTNAVNHRCGCEEPARFKHCLPKVPYTMWNLTGGDGLMAGFLWGFLDALWLSLGTLWVTSSVSSLYVHNRSSGC